MAADQIEEMDSDSVNYDESESITKSLFTHVMNGKWKEVVENFKQKPKAQNAKITRSGDTALHVAVSEGKFDVVRQLVGLIHPNNVSRVLRAKNERGNTPLHLAAALGTVAMCKCIAERDRTLIGAANNDGETPLFLSVLHGKTKAFLCLHEKSPNDAIKNYSYCTRTSDGDTILHCAIFREYFGLAYQIIQKYKDLVNRRNEKGEIPLHVLATKPSAFKSGSRLGIYDKIIYHCVFVGPLVVETLHEEDYECDSEDKCSSKYPDNYRTCVNFFWLPMTVFKVLGGKNNGSQGEDFSTTKKKTGMLIDIPVETLDKEDYKDDSEDKRSSKYPYIYRICATLFRLLGNFFRLLVNAIKVLVPGPPDVENPKKVSHYVFVDPLLSTKTSFCGPGGSGPIRARLHEGESSNAMQIRSAESVLIDIPVETSDKEEDDSEDKRSSKYPLHEGESSNATQNRSFEHPKNQRSRLVPPNYETLFSLFNLVMRGLLIVLGLGLTRIQKIKDKKQKHTWSIQIMDKLLLEKTSVWEFDAGGNPKLAHPFDENMPSDLASEEDASTNTKGSDTTTRNNNEAPNQEGDKYNETGKRETPILLAAKYGVAEMVKEILNKFPVAIDDSDSDKKNLVLLAVENRQPHIYKLLLERDLQKKSIFTKLDNQGNSALHLAATLGKQKPWRTPGAALQMQWEIKWYKFVKDSLPRNYFVHYNTKGQTPKEVFNGTHKDLVKEGGQWLTNTSQSCSVVAALIATVAFATSSTVPGGVKQDYGTPTLEGQPAFNVFAISSLVALCFSVTSLVMFLAILTSRYQEKDFARNLPNKLMIGLTSLFISIAAILVSFCSAHFFVIKDNLKYAAYPVYALTCLPVTFFAAAQLPLYVDLIESTFNKVPQLSSR